MSHIKVKRIYDPAGAEDGRRILVDRLWPRGVSKEKAELSLWMKEVAPSAALRTWFHAEPERMAERYDLFREKYVAELADPSLRERLGQLKRWAEDGTVTLLYAANTGERNHARVLMEVIESFPREPSPIDE